MRGRCTLPLTLTLMGPLNLMGTKFQDLKVLETPSPPPCAFTPRPRWMSKESLSIIDERTVRHQQPEHNWNMSHTLMRGVWRLLIEEYWQCLEVYKKKIGVYLGTKQGAFPYIQGSYTIVDRWYYHALMRQPNPSQSDMENVSRHYAALYQWEEPSPLGMQVPSHVISFQIDEGFPT